MHEDFYTAYRNEIYLVILACMLLIRPYLIFTYMHSLLENIRYSILYVNNIYDDCLYVATIYINNINVY